MTMDDETTEPRRFRLIPITVVMLSLLLLIKVNELYIGSRQLREIYSVRDATAEDKKPDEKAADAKPADAKKDEAPADAAKGDAKKEGEADAKSEKKEGEKDAKPPEEPKTFGTGKSTIKQIEAMKAKETAPRFSQNEIDLLENLAKRRDEIDAREKELDIKSKVLDATQKRIDDKLAEMKALDAQLSKTVALYNEKQNAQIASLVKIYEAMKPGQAAAIFDELDLPILLEVIDKMSERRVAPVLALMNPKKARDVTEELAAMRKSTSKVAPGAPGTAKPPTAAK